MSPGFPAPRQCVPIQGRGFWTGGYKCDCKQGYEYPFEDPITYFDGQLVEAEFLNLVNDDPTRSVEHPWTPTC